MQVLLKQLVSLSIKTMDEVVQYVTVRDDLSPNPNSGRLCKWVYEKRPEDTCNNM